MFTLRHSYGKSPLIIGKSTINDEFLWLCQPLPEGNLNFCLLRIDCPAHRMREPKVPPEHRANGESFDLPQAGSTQRGRGWRCVSWFHGWVSFLLSLFYHIQLSWLFCCFFYLMRVLWWFGLPPFCCGKMLRRLPETNWAAEIIFSFPSGISSGKNHSKGLNRHGSMAHVQQHADAQTMVSWAMISFEIPSGNLRLTMENHHFL